MPRRRRNAEAIEDSHLQQHMNGSSPKEGIFAKRRHMRDIALNMPFPPCFKKRVSHYEEKCRRYAGRQHQYQNVPATRCSQKNSARAYIHAGGGRRHVAGAILQCTSAYQRVKKVCANATRIFSAPWARVHECRGKQKWRRTAMKANARELQKNFLSPEVRSKRALWYVCVWRRSSLCSHTLLPAKWEEGEEKNSGVGKVCRGQEVVR